ncbi:MAG: lycopene cyclase domain-containing protein [Candidatus Portnoybacteria bacterium]|nr:lycopene cyclase domain-containing protein [Candidatus Portnoybacteria bacterium]
MPLKFVYAFACLILSLPWIFIYMKRKDLRTEMIWASLAGLPFGFVDYFLVPYYWNPESLFDLIKKYGIGIESFVFFFFMAGIASVIYDFLFGKKTGKLKKGNFRMLPVLVALSCFLILMIGHPDRAVYALMAAVAFGAALTIYLRRDLAVQAISSSFIFALLYFFTFFIVIKLFPEMISNFYNLESTWGIFLAGVPLEEIGLAFMLGAFWSGSYETIKMRKERK